MLTFLVADCARDFHQWTSGEHAGLVLRIEHPKVIWARKSSPPDYFQLREIWDSGHLVIQHSDATKVSPHLQPRKSSDVDWWTRTQSCTTFIQHKYPTYLCLD